MRRTIQCNGVRTVGTIVRRFIQFVWQKIFTKDCDNDSKATRKFSLSNQYFLSSLSVAFSYAIGCRHITIERTNQRMNKEEKINQTKSEILCLRQFSLGVFSGFSGHAYTQQNRVIIFNLLFWLQKSFVEQRNLTHLYKRRGLNLAFSVNCRFVCISMSFEFYFKIFFNSYIFFCLFCNAIFSRHFSFILFVCVCFLWLIIFFGVHLNRIEME